MTTMAGSTTTTTTTETAAVTSPVHYKKRLEGITIKANNNDNSVLLDLWKDTYNDSIKVVVGTGTESSSSPIVVVVSAAPKTKAEAIEVLRNAGDPSSKIMKSSKKKKKTNNIDDAVDVVVVMPIRVLQSIRILLPAAKIELLDRALDDLLLAFTPAPPEPELTTDRKRYLHRMDKLRLQSEETKYTRITNNIKDQRQEDDTTTKSMTYAASVGINMIVAPISFGAFMYFFSGGVFDFFMPPAEDGEDDFNTKRGTRRNLNPTGVDIKRVIIAVISGVAMMIIEMILFVIRTHEFEAHTTKKKKKRGVEPFGAYSAKMPMTYTDDNPNPAAGGKKKNDNSNSNTNNKKKKGEEQQQLAAAKKKK